MRTCFDVGVQGGGACQAAGTGMERLHVVSLMAQSHASDCQVLPGYLREEIVFTATEKQKLVGRILEALGTLTMRAARDAAQQQQKQAAAV